MSIHKRIASVLLPIASVAMIVAIGMGLLGFARQAVQGTLNPSDIPISLYSVWLALVLGLGLVFTRFNLMQTMRFLSQYGIGLGLILLVLSLPVVRGLEIDVLRWPYFLIWFAPVSAWILWRGIRGLRSEQHRSQP
jgi:xanthine/uracil permease